MPVSIFKNFTLCTSYESIKLLRVFNKIKKCFIILKNKLTTLVQCLQNFKIFDKT